MKQTSEKWFTNMNNIQHGRPRREIPQNAGLSGGAHRRQNPARMRACSARGPASNGVKNVLTLSCCRGVIVSRTKAEKRSASRGCGPARAHKNGFRAVWGTAGKSPVCGKRPESAASALPLIVPTIIQKSLQKKSSQFLEKSQAYIAFVQDKPVYEKFQNPDQGQTEKTSDDRGNGSDNRIVLRDLALSYGDRAIFENLNLCFEKGKSYLITGTSGCGKSSLLKMVAGEMTPSAGEISVFGSRPESYPLVSYVSQDTYIFEDTVRDNITLGKEKSKAEIDALIDFLQLNLDCDEKIDSSREISGGEKKRIGLARAFVTTNEVMLLDEITNGLNHALAMEITKKILALHKTVLFVSHDVSDDFRNLFGGIIDLSGEA